MFEKYKKSPTLYKAYLENQEKLRKEQELEQKKTETARKEVEKPEKVSYRGTAQIGVMALYHGCGTTYLCELIAMFLSKYKKGKTCLIETKGLEKELSDASFQVVTYPCDLSSVYKEHYEFIVRDFGVYDGMKADTYSDWERMDYQCVVTWPDEKSLYRLASFVRNTEHAEKFIYFFNLVPKDMVHEILDIMMDYQVVILPCISMSKLDKSFLTELHAIFGKG